MRRTAIRLLQEVNEEPATATCTSSEGGEMGGGLSVIAERAGE